MTLSEIKYFLDEKCALYNQPKFIESDPIQVPKLFIEKEDIEIAAFLTSIISWGKRTSIIKNAMHLMKLMDYHPHDFVMHATEEEKKPLQSFVHRTFNGSDCTYSIQALKHLNTKYGGLQHLFESAYIEQGSIKYTLKKLHEAFFEMPGERTRKHIANVDQGASAKRLNMFLRWMVRSDKRGVDFGLWKGIPQSALMLPLDVHTGNVARKLGILNRKQNDWKAVEEVTNVLQTFDPDDPIKYDFALFGLGIFEEF